MIPNDCLGIISEYMDLHIYKSLISPCPKIFNKYEKLKKSYELSFSNQISDEYNFMFEKLKNISKRNSTPKIKYFFIKNQYETIKKIIYALEFCNIFRSTDIDENLEIINFKNSCDKDIRDKCRLKGYLPEIKEEVTIEYCKSTNY